MIHGVHDSRAARLVVLRRGLTTAMVLLANAALLLGSLSCTSRESGPKTHVTIGLQLSPAMTLVMVAKDEGFFEREGLDVEIKGFSAGKFALQAFFGRALDFAVAGDVPITLATLQGNKVTILTQVVERTINEVRVVARKDNAMPAANAHDYFTAKKRKLATSFGGGPEFFTARFLERNKIPTAGVEIISQRPEDMSAALVSGTVDAISIFDPFAFIAEKQLGTSGMTFTDPKGYSELYLLVGAPDVVQTRRPVVDALLRALIRAEDLIKKNPARAKQIAATYTQLDAAVLDGVWQNFVFAPALTPQLLEFMSAEAAWARSKGVIPDTSSAPDFRRMIAEEPLRRLKAAAVRIP